jgi:RNAse (barnase) inhibitor barstar
MSQIPFLFVEEDAHREWAIRARIPAAIAHKEALLVILAQQLNFPDYFGGNWDAFEECVRDLCWLPAGPVVLKHVDLPLINDLKNARIYLCVLAGAINKMAKSEDHPLTVIFPIELRDQITWLLRRG